MAILAAVEGARPATRKEDGVSQVSRKLLGAGVGARGFPPGGTPGSTAGETPAATLVAAWPRCCCIAELNSAQPWQVRTASASCGGLPIANRRYGRVQLCATPSGWRRAKELPDGRGQGRGLLLLCRSCGFGDSWRRHQAAAVFGACFPGPQVKKAQTASSRRLKTPSVCSTAITLLWMKERATP